MTSRPPNTFLACGAVTLFLYAVFLALHPVFRMVGLRALKLTSWTRQFVSAQPLQSELLADIVEAFGDPWAKTAAYAGFILLLILCVLGAYRAARGGARVTERHVLVGYVLFAALLVPTLPMFSIDVLGYIAIGEMLDTTTVNPYETTLSAHRDLEMLQFARPVRHATLYGPLAVRLFQGLHFAGLGPYGNLVVLKSFLALAGLLALVLGAATMRRLGVERRERVALLTLVAWNPLLLLEGVAHGHVDIVAFLLLALGIWWIAAGRTTLGLVAAAGMAAIKITFVAVLPAIVGLAYFGVGRGRAGVLRVTTVLVSSLAVWIALLAPDLLGSNPLAPVLSLKAHATNSLTFVVEEGLRAVGMQWSGVRMVGVVVFAGVVSIGLSGVRSASAFYARSARDLLVFLLFINPVVHPWYAIAAFAPAMVGRKRGHVVALMVFAATSLIPFYALRLFHGQFTFGAAFTNYFLGVLPASVVLLALRGGPGPASDNQG